MNLVENYSGVVVNQNQTPSLSSDRLDVSDGAWRYQEFFLPDNYVRGTDDSELLIPPLTGSQIAVKTDDASASVDWKIQYNVFGAGWLTVSSGTTTGIHATGDLVWMDLPFDQPEPVNFEALPLRFRLGLRTDSDVSIWFSTPNPLANKFAKVRAADEVTPIQSGGQDIAFMFRTLGLTADEGVDYLGNTYRSAVRFSPATNVDTVSGSENSIWLSKPNPSRFAVENLYFDVRPVRSLPTYQIVNRNPYPNFESDLGGWTNSSPGVTVSTFATSTDWAKNGAASLHIVGQKDNSATLRFFVARTPDGLDGIRVTPNTSYVLQAAVNVIDDAAGGCNCRIEWFDSTGAMISGNSGTVFTGTGLNTNLVVATAPSNATFAQLKVQANSSIANDTLDMYVDSIIFIEGSGPVTYVDGAMSGFQWTGVPNSSITLKVFSPDINDVEAVIDNVLVDPITPNVYFSVYYSSDGEPGTNEEEWDWKLWDRVPQTFKATKRESHALPEPIRAKYIKIEFSHLQADHYSPGQFAQPIKYKKHPKWVLDYFLARLDAERDTERLLTGRVAVIYNALDLAYNYYLDDINQAPDVPYEKNADYQTAATFLDQRTDVSDQVDPVMLEKINLSLAPYRDHISIFADSGSLLGQQVQTEATTNFGDQPVERVSGTVDRADLKELRNEAVVFESDYPVMFFYLTCRHRYREVVANFENDKAYFVGIREVSFQRQRYATAYDTTQYIEPAGDMLNTERNDFTMQGGTMVIA